MSVQVQLLRVLNTRDYQRAGELTTLLWRGKLITATNETISPGHSKFRSDLFFRLTGHVIVMKEHRELEHADRHAITHGVILCTLRQVEADLGVPAGRELLDITEGGITKLVMRSYRGNIRELRHVTWTAANNAVAATHIIDESCIPDPKELGRDDADAASLSRLRDIARRDIATVVLDVAQRYGVKPSELVLRFLSDHLPESHYRVTSHKSAADRLGIAKETLKRVHADPGVEKAAKALTAELMGRAR